MSYELRWHPGGVTKYFFSIVTNDDMLLSVYESEADSRFENLRYVINDFLEIEGCDFETPIAERIAIQDRGAAFTNPNIRIAVVTTHPQVIAAAEAYAASPLNVYPTKIFSTLQEARVWLGFPRADDPQGN